MKYLVSINGTQSGPYELEYLRERVADGTINPSHPARPESSLRWKQLLEFLTPPPPKASHSHDIQRTSPTPRSTITCPYCACFVTTTHIETHKKQRCPRAPADIIAARPPRPSRPRSSRHIRTAHGGPLQKDEERERQRIGYAKYVRAQRDSMGD